MGEMYSSWSGEKSNSLIMALLKKLGSVNSLADVENVFKHELKTLFCYERVNYYFLDPRKSNSEECVTSLELHNTKETEEFSKVKLSEHWVSWLSEQKPLHRGVCVFHAGQVGGQVLYVCIQFKMNNPQWSRLQSHLLEFLMPKVVEMIERVCLQVNKGCQEVFTNREHEVLRWMHAGKSNQEIGDLLHISRCTVKNHVHSILKKLKAENRIQAIVKSKSLDALAWLR